MTRQKTKWINCSVDVDMYDEIEQHCKTKTKVNRRGKEVRYGKSELFKDLWLFYKSEMNRKKKELEPKISQVEQLEAEVERLRAEIDAELKLNTTA